MGASLYGFKSRPRYQIERGRCPKGQRPSVPSYQCFCKDAEGLLELGRQFAVLPGAVQNNVRAILAKDISAERILLKNKKNMCNVLLDGSSWKVICRFDFQDSSHQLLSIPCENSDGVRVELKCISDIYQHTEQLRKRGNELIDKTWKRQSRSSKTEAAVTMSDHETERK